MRLCVCPRRLPAYRTVCLAFPPATLLRMTRAADAPPSDGVVRHDDGSLPVGKHIVRDVNGASREGDAAVEGHVQKHFDYLLFGEADV